MVPTRIGGASLCAVSLSFASLMAILLEYQKRGFDATDRAAKMCGIVLARQEGGWSRVMPFSEALKLTVKRKAAFRCCRCHEIGIDIHHIVPEAEGGPDDIDNAAPLCQNCHARFGANPEKQKEIRQMRDFWYEVVEERYHGDQSQFAKLNETILNIQQASKAEMDELRKELRTEVIEEVKALRVIQQEAFEKLNYVPVVDLPRQANSALSASVAFLGVGIGSGSSSANAQSASSPDFPGNLQKK